MMVVDRRWCPPCAVNGTHEASIRHPEPVHTGIARGRGHLAKCRPDNFSEAGFRVPDQVHLELVTVLQVHAIDADHKAVADPVVEFSEGLDNLKAQVTAQLMNHLGVQAPQATFWAGVIARMNSRKVTHSGLPKTARSLSAQVLPSLPEKLTSLHKLRKSNKPP
jgi:hypothetical protein